MTALPYLIAALYWAIAPSAVCSHYGASWNGLETASGLIYNCEEYTCAHCHLPMGAVIHMYNDGRWCKVVVTDTGPWRVDSAGNAVFPLRPHPTRQFDLSTAVFRHLSGDDLDSGVMRVRWRVVGRDITGMRYGTGVAENAGERERLTDGRRKDHASQR